VFATDAPALRDVFVAGRHVVQGGRHAGEAAIARRFADVMAELWGSSAGTAA
jgi:hypothetical protein